MMYALNATKHGRPERTSLRDSSLTFAVIWDPENGLEAFSTEPLFDNSVELPSTKPAQLEYCLPDSKPDLRGFDEPFAVFGSRQLHFIDIRSSKLYEKCVAGDFDNVSLHSTSSSASCYSTDSFFESDPARARFTAIPGIDLEDAPTSYVDPGPRHLTCHPRSNTNQTSGSSLEGENLTAWGNYSHFLARVKEQDIEDEGFFEASSHADCDPHLPSRFSTSTTATLAYFAANVNVQGTQPMPIIGPIIRRPVVIASGSSTSNDRASKIARVGHRIGSFTDKGLRCSSSLRSGSIRFSKVFRGSWFKRPGSVGEDERWVLVDIQAIVIDRILDD